MKTRVMLTFSLRELCNIILYICPPVHCNAHGFWLMLCSNSEVTSTLSNFCSMDLCSCFLAFQLSSLPVADSSKLVFPHQLLLSLPSVWPIQRHFLCITDFTIRHSYLRSREVTITAKIRYGNRPFSRLSITFLF